MTSCCLFDDKLKSFVGKDLEHINIQGGDASSCIDTLMADIINTNPRLLQINMVGCCLNFDCGDVLSKVCEALKVHKRIEHIDMRHNRMQEMGLCAMAEVLEVNKTIHTLNLSGNEYFEEEASERFAEALCV